MNNTIETIELVMGSLATMIASTKRPPTFSGGKRGDPEAHLSSFWCFPLDPANPEVAADYRTGRTQEVLQTFCEGGLDIKEGDRLVVGSTEYPIRAVADWYWKPDGSNYLQLIVEDVK